PLAGGGEGEKAARLAGDAVAVDVGVQVDALAVSRPFGALHARAAVAADGLLLAGGLDVRDRLRLAGLHHHHVDGRAAGGGDDADARLLRLGQRRAVGADGLPAADVRLPAPVRGRGAGLRGEGRGGGQRDGAGDDAEPPYWTHANAHGHVPGQNRTVRPAVAAAPER